MLEKLCVIVISSVILTLSSCYDITAFDDTVTFNLQWPGNDLDNIDLTRGERIIITTNHQEKYTCILPDVQEKKLSDGEVYDGASGFELISPLFAYSTCSYRLESYWTYEICHGKFIRQYHEEREGNKVKVQEYILGRWDSGTYVKYLKDFLDREENKDAVIPSKKIDNMILPYLEVTMDNGTLCELIRNKPRQTKVIYVCYVHGKNEVYSLKETSSCQYEVIILSSLLCAHPKYKPKETSENHISCLPLDGNPKKPYALKKMNAENAKMRHRTDIDRVGFEFTQPEFNDKKDVEKKDTETSDTSLSDFLSGKSCLTGGTGWWKYEFCYGKYVQQYHTDKDGTKTALLLGVFDKAKHLDWIAARQQKKPKPTGTRMHLSHFYSDGTICDKTNRPRQTEVRLKCSPFSSKPLYLLEPRYCEYILGVESPLICDLLSKADKNDLVEIEKQDEDDDDTSINITKS